MPNRATILRKPAVVTHKPSDLGYPNRLRSGLTSSWPKQGVYRAVVPKSAYGALLRSARTSFSDTSRRIAANIAKLPGAAKNDRKQTSFNLQYARAAVIIGGLIEVLAQRRMLLFQVVQEST
jgi:hypothetical protein